MTSLKMTLLPLAVYLLLSLLSQVSGKPSPRHLLVETKNKSKVKKSSDYVNNINNGPGGGIGAVVDKSFNDYVENINNHVGGSINHIDDRSFNVDYVNNIKNNGKVGLIKDASLNIGKGSDYVNNINNGGFMGSVVDASANFRG